MSICEELGEERSARLAQAFYSLLTPPSPTTPLAFEPAASVAIAEVG